MDTPLVITGSLVIPNNTVLVLSFEVSTNAPIVVSGITFALTVTKILFACRYWFSRMWMGV